MIINNQFIPSIVRLYHTVKRSIRNGYYYTWYALTKRKVILHSFECNPVYRLNRGYLVLTWNVESAYKVLLSGIGDVTKLNQIVVQANANVMSYTLTAYGYDSVITKTVTTDITPFDMKQIKIKVHPFDVSKIDETTDQLKRVRVQISTIQQTQGLNINVQTLNVTVKNLFIGVILPSIQLRQRLLQIQLKNPQVMVQNKRIAIVPKVPHPDEHKLQKLKEINDIRKLDEMLSQLD